MMTMNFFPSSADTENHKLDHIIGLDDLNDDLFALGASGAQITSDEAARVGSPSSSSNGQRPGVEDAFPIILHAIVSDKSTDSCINWLPCGTRFVISNKEEFTSDILPRYFAGRGPSTTKYTSFTRRLKRWNFTRVPSGREMGAYYHEHFKRGEPELAKKVMYPVLSKSQTASKEGKRPNNNGPKRVMPKGHRRASTGSIPPGASLKLAAERLERSPERGGISPMPVRDRVKPIQETSYSINPTDLPDLDNDMKDWLFNTVLDGDVQQPSTNNNSLQQPSTNNNSLQHPTTNNNSLQQPSMNSNSLQQPSMNSSSLQQPSMNNNSLQQTSTNNNSLHRTAWGFQGSGFAGGGTMVGTMVGTMEPMMMMRPGPVRRASMPCGAMNSFLLSQLNEIDCSMGMGAATNNMTFASDDMLTMSAAAQPRPPELSRSGGDNSSFGLSRECSLDDLKNFIDPFS